MRAYEFTYETAMINRASPYEKETMTPHLNFLRSMFLFGKAHKYLESDLRAIRSEISSFSSKAETHAGEKLEMYEPPPVGLSVTFLITQFDKAVCFHETA